MKSLADELPPEIARQIDPSGARTRPRTGLCAANSFANTKVSGSVLLMAV